MRKAFVLVVILLLAPLTYVSADDDSIHLWSEQAPGAILLWDDSGNLTPVDPDLPIDLHLPEGNWTMVRLIDGVPQDAILTFGDDKNASNFLDQTVEVPLAINGMADRKSVV